MENKNKLQDSVIMTASSVLNITNVLIDYARENYNQFVNWKIVPFINQREFIKDAKKIEKAAKEIFFVDGLVTFSQFTIFVDTDNAAIYLLDGGQRISKAIISCCSLLKAMKNQNENGCYSKQIEQLENILFRDENHTPKYEFRFECDRISFNKITEDIFLDDGLGTKENDKMFDSYEKLADSFSEELEDSEIVDEMFEHASEQTYISFADYTKTGMDPSDIYVQISGSGTEHKKYEILEGLLLCKVNGSQFAEKYAKDLHENTRSFTPFKNSSMKLEEKKNTFYELHGFVYFETARATNDGLRQTLTVKEDGLKNTLMQALPTLESATRYLDSQEEFRGKVNEYCEKYYNFKMLYSPRVNPSFMMCGVAYLITYFLSEKAADESTINEVLGILRNVLVKMMTTGATCDKQFEQSLWERFKKEYGRERASSNKAVQFLKDALKSFEFIPDEKNPDDDVKGKRKIISDEVMEGIVSSCFTNWLETKGKKEAAEMMLIPSRHGGKGENLWMDVKTSSIEHNITRKICGNNGLSDYTHCIANLNVLPLTVNNSKEAKGTFTEKMCYIEIAKWFNQDEMNEIVPLLKDIDSGCDTLSLNEIEEKFKEACKKRAEFLAPFYCTGF